MKIPDFIFVKKWWFYLFLFFGTASCWAQPSFRGLENLFTSPESYVVRHTSVKPVIDGNITDAVWQNASWSNFFRDIEGKSKPDPYYKTRVKMLWDDNYIYFAADIEDNHVWANLRNHDEVVYNDNDFEIFIDPDNNTHQYFEVEVNALNTIFDLFLSKPYRNNSHELVGWNAEGMRTAVKIHGTLNNPKDKDKGWTVEIAIPIKALTIGGNVVIPEEGTLWRINFSRVEWNTDIINGKYVKKKSPEGKVLPENNWVWSPPGLINMHYPERWGYLLFTAKQDPNQLPDFKLPYAEKQKQYLWLVYYRQKEYMDKHKRYASTLEELNINPVTFELDNVENSLVMEATAHQFNAAISSQNNKTWSINDEGLIEVRK
ncbi:carbohydrate-binding family 9-like protein [uncultured Bacteroides sp.]|uniref:carbohydrate-binding family 9-like protein n=1 Tax=uncultured Bacteroides sp. TaxID=162156 RepID=UPI002AAAE025|nr:carbohydrate-binding family 9-like protein [uncultured Bacteroides sp.]